MTPSGQTICLCMIVKNEAPVIRRCLASVRPIIDAWLVVDTGSTDGTQEIVRAALRDLPGELVERPWVDFAHNRSEALKLARGRGHYALIIDADDALEPTDGFSMPDLLADAYVLGIRDGDVTYQRMQMVSNALPWRYEGVLHEYLECDETARTEHLPLLMRRNHDGARRRDPDTYRKDAAILERALQVETRAFLQARYTFYLAQSYRDCGEPTKAIDVYLRRADMGHWEQEVFVSLYQAGRLMEQLGRDAQEVLAVYRRATDACPARIEAAYAASRLCRTLSRFREGFEIARAAIGRPAPADGLFVEAWIYDYGLLDEYAVNAYWAERHRECLEACLTLLGSAALPVGERTRILANARFALNGVNGKLWDGSDAWILHRPDDIRAEPQQWRLNVRRSMSDPGLVSIITPTRNRGAFLQRALRYVREQTLGNNEWLILDDSDERPTLPSEFSSGNISYTYTARQLTIGEKRNLLVEQAKGSTIVQFDDDDYYAPGYVSAMVSAMTERKADLINLRGWFMYDLRSRFFGYWDLMRKDGLHYRCDQDGIAAMLMNEDAGDAFRNNEYGYGFSYAFKKSVWRKHKFEPVDWNEDGIFFLRSRQDHRTDGLYDTAGLCLHILHSGSTSRCFPQYHLPNATFRTIFPTLEWISA